MSRVQVLLAALAGLLVIALFVVLVAQPQREELARLEDEAAAERQQQAQLDAEIAQLRMVRERVAETEGEIAAAEAILPPSAALPAALRQLQLAADESELILEAVTAARPEEPLSETPEAEPSSIDVTVQLVGSYFQVVDFLRRVEDPRITPRGVSWRAGSVVVDEYPDLNVSLTGELYATIDTAPPELVDPVVPEAAPDEAEVTEDDEPADAPDVEVDTEVDIDEDAGAEETP